jgi:hypothetical protein
MPRRPSPVPLEHIHVTVPAAEKQRVELLLWSDAERRVPQGAWQQFILERIREYFDQATLDLSPYGFPLGFFVRGPKGMIQALKQRFEEVTSE